MLSLVKILLFGHILSAIVWIGAGFTVELLSFRATQSLNRDKIIEVLYFGEWLAKRVFMPAALLTLIFGILLVVVGKPTFHQFWIIFALVGVFVTAILGGAYVGRTSAQLLKISKAKKTKDKKIFNLFSKITLYSHLDLALLIIIVFDMVLKPKITDTSFFLISGIFFLLVLALSIKRYRKEVL
jgi:hypothetical protein